MWRSTRRVSKTLNDWQRNTGLILLSEKISLLIRPHIVFVRAKDADALDAICKEHQAMAMTKGKKPSVLAQLKKFKELVAALPKKVREKKQERDL